MGLFDKLFGKSDPPEKKETPEASPARLILVTGVMSTKIMFDNGEFSKAAGFEVLLFSTLRILRKFKQRRPELYEKFEEEYFEELLLFAHQQELLKVIPGDFGDFVNNRFKLYSDQLDLMMNNKDGLALPMKMVFNFYEEPLVPESGDTFNLTAMVTMQIRLKHLFEALDSCVDLVIKEKNL